MSTFTKELGFALRGLRKNPGFAATAILTLALGIGASTAIFSVVNAILLRPLPYEEPERLAIVWGDMRNRNVNDFPFAPGDFKDLRDGSGAIFSGVAGVQTGRQPITDDGTRPEMVRVAFATSNIFSVLGVRPAVGRLFVDDDGTPQPAPPPPAPAGSGGAAVAPAQPATPPLPAVIVLSHEFWMRRFGGDTSVIGRTIPFGFNSAQVVGVLEPGVELVMSPKANLERYPDAWLSMRINFDNASRINHNLRVIARLRDGVTFAQAQGYVDRFGTTLREQFPIKNSAGLYFRTEPMHLDAVRAVRRPLVLLLGAVGFVLLIACANVANLLLLRASARERELAVRAALGGSRLAIVRQLLTESLVLAGIGAGLGVLLAQAGIDLLAAIAPANLPRVDRVSIDLWVLAFTIAASLASSVLFGLVPALRASRPNLADVLRSGRAASQFGAATLRNSVVVAEVALSFVLLVGSGLMLRSFIAVARTDPGFEPSGVLTFTLRNPRPRDQAAAQAFMSQFEGKLRAIPGVVGVSQVTSLPLDGTDPNVRWVQEHLAADEKAFRQAQTFSVNPSYLQTMRTQVVAGRMMTDADIVPFPDIPQNTPQPQAQAMIAQWEQIVKPVMVDEQFAARAYPGESVIGKRILARRGGNAMTPFEIIGVVKHQRHTRIVGDEREMVFFPQPTLMNGVWIVRTNSTMAGLPQLVRAALAEVEPQAPISDVEPMMTYVNRAMAPTRFALVMLSIFAVIAAVLAAVGLYGVLASAVRQRTAEIGVRMAFGAPSNTIFRMVVGQGLKLSGIGVAIGLIGAMAMTGALKSMLVGVTATDPVTYALMAALFVGVAAFACWVPARRAAALDPNVALREE